MYLRLVSRNFDQAVNILLKEGFNRLELTFARSRSGNNYKSAVGRRYDPRHGPSMYKNRKEDYTRLEGSDFEQHYRNRDDVNVKFTDARIDRLRNPTSADVYLYHYYQSRKFARDVYAKYGMASGVDPSLCLPDEKELRELKETLARERPIKEMLAEVEFERDEFERRKAERDEKLREKVSQMPSMIRDWMETEQKEKQKSALLQKKKTEYMERIRQHYGGRITPSSPEFDRIIEMLLDEDWNKEDKKMQDRKKREKRRKGVEVKEETDLKSAPADGAFESSVEDKLNSVQK